MNNLLIIIVIIVIALGGYYFYNSQTTEISTPLDTPTATTTSVTDGTYAFNTTNSTITWEGKKPLVPGYVDTGSIKLSSGGVTLSNSIITAGQIVIDMTSIAVASTGKGKDESLLVKHLKSDDFFDVEKNPTATFMLKSATKDTINTNKYILTGDLTIRGTTNTIDIPANLTQTDNTLVLNGEAVVNRAKFNVKYGSGSFFEDLGDKIIDDNFKLSFSLVLEK